MPPRPPAVRSRSTGKARAPGRAWSLRPALMLLIALAVSGLVQPGRAADAADAADLADPRGSPPAPTLPAPSTAPPTAPPTAAPGPATDEPPPSAQELIAQALERGDIDLPTSLVDRGFALWGDGRLPAELRGRGSDGEDATLRDEILALGDDVPADLAAVLTSLVVRPADPRSIANRLRAARDAAAAPRTAIAAGSDRTAARAGRTATRADRATAALGPLLRCPRSFGWASFRTQDPGMNFRIWASCDGREVRDILKAIAFMRTIWWPMVQYMGPPIPDDGTGGDDAIDIYLVTPGEEARDVTIPTDALAAAWGTEPTLGRRMSGFILIGRDGIASDDWKQTLIHEFFHVLQFRHNALITQRTVGSETYGWWFTEASATWAEQFFGRPRSAGMPHAWRFRPFQATSSTTTLTVSLPKLHKYHAYVWPMFMQQELGDQVIRRAWDRLEGVRPGDHQDADRVLNGLVPFKTRFREFAVRLLDQELPGDPIAPRLQELDPAVPLARPVIEDRNRLPPVRMTDLGHTIPETIPALTATYVQLDPDPETFQVTLDFRRLQPAADLDIDLVYRIFGEPEWRRRTVAPDERVRFCMNRKDQDLADLYVILSNHQMTQGSTVRGSFRVRPVAEPCGQYRIAGSWKLRTGQGGVLIDTDFDATWDFSWDPGYDPGEPGVGTFRSSLATGGPPLPCVPGRFREVMGRLVTSASHLKGRVTFVLWPAYPPGTPSTTDIFSTLFVMPKFGSLWVEVPIGGGRRRWRDGAQPLRIICGGLLPRGLGTATVTRLRDT